MAPVGLTPVDEVIDFLVSAAKCLVSTETLPISRAAGRILAEDLVSNINVPQADNSAMDGYAVDITGLQPDAVLAISDRIPAGSVGKTLASGTMARIFTGAPIPDGANAVIIQEDTRLSGDRVQIGQVPEAGKNIRRAGQDIQVGSIILRAGRCLRPQDLGLMASVGYDKVRVFKPLRVAVMSTGDELVEPPESLQPGQIYNSNQYALIALVQASGFTAVDIGLVKDEPAATEAALLRAANEADCIISSGGVSVGDEDHVKAALEKLGKLSLWRLAIKPGKPLAFGAVGEVPFFGLPGNPVSSFVTFMMIARPYLLKSQGASELHLDLVHATADFSYKGGSRREYLRVQLSYDQAGRSRVVNYPHQGSGIMSSVSWANGLAEIEIHQDVQVGDLLKIHRLI
ncbi:MAG: molybdopterin molybdotransferase MoeA [Pseudomonadales bacterium]|nr:molybdopterin molybdotransferase MoeA [Pseudomonadales bacterium]